MRKIFAGLIFSFILLLAGTGIFGYNDTVTHPSLTIKAMELYDSQFNGQLTGQQKEWIKKGSINEDTFPRYFNHFYSPETGKGLDSVEFDMNVSGMTAKEWAFNQENVTSGDYSVGKILENYKYGEYQRAYEGIGHIMHLMQDMTVPAHTRNDPHGDGDPYEKWAKENASLDGISINEIPDITIEQAFDKTAWYSYDNFLSIDSIDEEILRKNINTYNIIEKYLPEKNKNRKYLFKDGYILIAVDNSSLLPKFFLDEEDSNIHSDYWRMLSPEAVKYSLVVLDYFIKEFEKIDQEKINQQLSFIDKIQFKLTNIDNKLAYAWGDTAKKIESNVSAPVLETRRFLVNTFNNVKSAFISSSQPAGPGFVVESNAVPTENNNNDINNTLVAPDVPIEANQDEPIVYIDNTPPAPTTEPIAQEEPITIKPETNLEAKPLSDVVVQQNNSNPPPYAGFGGGGGGGAPPPLAAPVSLEPQSEPEPQPEPEPPADTTPPDISLLVTECSASLSDNGCLIATTTFHISWSSLADDLDYYEFNNNGTVSTTTATSTIESVENDSLNNLSVRAIDKDGNWSEGQSILVSVSTMPVVINEVAWAGTFNHPEDEWIELYNRTNYDINLGNWILFSNTDQTPYLELQGTIPANGYYLIERKNTGEEDEATESPISDITADLWTSFGYGISNKGENIVLSYASTTIDQVPYINKWGGWDKKYTAERVDPDSKDSGWSMSLHPPAIKNGKNVDGAAINGTPQSRNSVSYLIAGGADSIASDTTLTKEKSPYLITKQQIIENGAVLTIEPGVIIKSSSMQTIGQIRVRSGKILAQGTESEPIVFTSLYDDEYGGDTSTDATSTSPFPGAWNGIDIKSGNNGSIFEHVIFRYGGQEPGKGSLNVSGSTAVINNSIFEHARVYGLVLTESTSEVIDNIFIDNNNTEDPLGKNSAVFVDGGSPIIKNNAFSGNNRGIYLSNSLAEIASNTFESNSGEAIYSFGSLSRFTSNTGVNNKINAITINGNLTQENATSTLVANQMPYYIWGYGTPTVIASSTLVINPGVVIKGSKIKYSSHMDVYGSLIVAGNNFDDIMFTSFYDDSFGGDTNNDNASSSPYTGSWEGIVMKPGSFSNIKGATFKYANTALTYQNSPINLENVRFSKNNLAIEADADSVVQTVASSTIEFLENSATTSPAGLW